MGLRVKPWQHSSALQATSQAVCPASLSARLKLCACAVVGSSRCRVYGGSVDAAATSCSLSAIRTLVEGSGSSDAGSSKNASAEVKAWYTSREGFAILCPSVSAIDNQPSSFFLW